jgi:hypothetical protein
MSLQEYIFHEQWFIPARAADVYSVLCDASLLPLWWRGVYLSLTSLGQYEGPQVGNRYQAVARGFLPYKLRFVLETAILDSNRQVGVRMEGDLIGTWTATLAEEVEGTRVKLVQHCRSGKRLIRWLSPLAKPLFAWNHRWTTPRGEAGLTSYLANRRQLTS